MAIWISLKPLKFVSRDHYLCNIVKIPLKNQLTIGLLPETCIISLKTCVSYLGGKKMGISYREHTTKSFPISFHSNIWPFFSIQNICNSQKRVIFREEQLSSKIYLRIIWAWPMKFFATGTFMQRHLDCKNTAMKPVCFRPKKHIFLAVLLTFLLGPSILTVHWHMSSKFWILLWTGSINHCLDLQQNTAYQSRS